MHNYMLVSEETGEPLMDEKGLPVTWMDLLSAVSRDMGCEIETAVNSNGEDMFRIVKREDP